MEFTLVNWCGEIKLLVSLKRVKYVFIRGAMSNPKRRSLDDKFIVI